MQDTCSVPAQIFSPNNLHPPERYGWLLPNFLYFLITYNIIIINLIEGGYMHAYQENCYDFLFFPETFNIINFKG